MWIVGNKYILLQLLDQQQTETYLHRRPIHKPDTNLIEPKLHGNEQNRIEQPPIRHHRAALSEPRPRQQTLSATPRQIQRLTGLRPHEPTPADSNPLGTRPKREGRGRKSRAMAQVKGERRI